MTVERGRAIMNKQTAPEDEASTAEAGGKAAEEKAQSLRKELDVLLDELKARGRRAFDVSYQVRKHPAVVAGVGLMLVGGVALAVSAAKRRKRQQHSLAARLAGIASVLAGQTPGSRPKLVVKKSGGTDFGPFARAAVGLLLPKLLPLIAGKLFQQQPAPPLPAGRSGADGRGR
jgi:hypothetical protein